MMPNYAINYLRKYKISQKEAHTVHYSHTVQYGILKIAEKWQVRNMSKKGTMKNKLSK